MNTNTKSPEAINYYELQATLSRAVSALNTSSSLSTATGMPFTRDEAMAQLPAIRELIARREAEIKAVQEAIWQVDKSNAFGGLDAYLDY